jgi:hypothetical protein
VRGLPSDRRNFLPHEHREPGFALVEVFAEQVFPVEVRAGRLTQTFRFDESHDRSVQITGVMMESREEIQPIAEILGTVSTQHEILGRRSLGHLPELQDELDLSLSVSDGSSKVLVQLVEDRPAFLAEDGLAARGDLAKSLVKSIAEFEGAATLAAAIKPVDDLLVQVR